MCLNRRLARSRKSGFLSQAPRRRMFVRSSPWLEALETRTLLSAAAVIGELDPDQMVWATPGPAIAAVEGRPTSSVLLATFIDFAGLDRSTNQAADINWGDGTPSEPSSGHIVANGNGSFNLYG